MTDPSAPPSFDATIDKAQSPESLSTIAASTSVLREGPGTHIGPYKLMQLIGEGGFGSVFMAHQEEPVQRTVALKIIKLGMDTRQVVARFEQERQALAMMDHPNIARVLDAGATDTGRPYFVMELVKGNPIVEYCDKNSLSIQDRLGLFAQVCQAVQHAHTKGIIHRDIKPSNILVSTQDGVPVTKVIDFGIAKATTSQLTTKTLLTDHHHFIGTPEYMSPEQAEGTMDIDTRTDVYSLGVLLYELLTGTTPFSTKDLPSAAYSDIQRYIREVEPPIPSTRLSRDTDSPSIAGIAARRRTEPRKLGATIRGELDWIVMKAIEKDRTRRYETANGLAMDIRRYLSREAVLAAPPSRLYWVRKFVRRHRVPVAAAGVIAVTLVTGIVGTSVGFVQARSAEVKADLNAVKANVSAEKARQAETVALAEKAVAQRQAYSANMLGASDALERGQIDAARDYLDSAPANARGWEWLHLSSRLDLTRRVHDQKTHLGRLHVAPDGRSYYGTSADPARSIQRWDIETGRLLQTIATDVPCRNSWLVANGRLLILRLSTDDTKAASIAEVWDLERGARLSSRAVPGRFQPALDGSKITYIWQGSVHIMDPRTGADRASPSMPPGTAPNWGDYVCFQPDGRRLAVECTLGKICLVDTESWQVQSTFEAHDNVIWAMAFSSDGTRLASASSDGTIRITDVAANPPVAVATMRGHGGEVQAVSFSPDASLVASRGQDRTVRLWDARTGAARGVFQTGDAEDGAAAFLPDGQTLISADVRGSVHFWDVRSADAWTLRGHQSYIYPVLISPDGARIYSGGWDGFVGQAGCIRFWDAASGAEIAAIGAANTYIFSGALSPDGSRLAFATNAVDSPRIEIIDAATGAFITKVSKSEFGETATNVVGSLAFDPTGRRLAWTGEHGTINVSDSQTGVTTQSRVVRDEAGISLRLAWSPDGAVIAVCDGMAGRLHILDGAALEPVRSWPLDHRGMVCVGAFAPDSRRIVTGAENGIARIWDVATGALVHELIGHGNRVLCAAYSPDNKRIATGGNDNFIRLWDAQTFEPVARLAGHLDYVYTLAWRADSGQLISGSGDHTVRIWDSQPLKDRMKARAERQETLARVEPMVQGLFTQLADASKVVERLRGEASLAPRAREVALQVALRTAIDRRAASAKPEGRP